MRASTRLVALLLALGCASSDAASGSASAPGGDVSLVTCESPRPQACTREYRPACGHRCAAPPCAADERRTYGNACDACADAAVNAHAPGTCEGEPPREAPKLR